MDLSEAILPPQEEAAPRSPKPAIPGSSPGCPLRASRSRSRNTALGADFPPPRVGAQSDDATLDLLCDHLTADRYEVLPAPSAADALRLCRYNHPEPKV